MGVKNVGQRIRFTKEAIARLKPAKARYNRFDSDTKGLGVVVHESGRKTFFHVRKVNGFPQRITLGDIEDLSIDQVRTKATELNGKLADWKMNDFDGPNPTKSNGKATLETVFESYITTHILKSAKEPEISAERERKFFALYIPAAWKARKLSAIQREEVEQLHADCGKERGERTANRVAQFIKTLYNYAEKRELYAGRNPAKFVELFTQHSRTRFLSKAEIARLFETMNTWRNRDLCDFVTLLLFAGCRKSDAYRMKWSDVDLDGATWHIPNPKNEEPYVVPLMDVLVKMLKARQRVNDFVFASDRPRSKEHIVALDIAWYALRKAAKIPDVRLHDLRRTLGSWQAELGSSLPIIGKSLGHVGTASTSIYARLAVGPVRASIEQAVDAMLKAGKLLQKENA